MSTPLGVSTPEQAFEAIYRATYSHLLAYARRRTSHDSDAHDVVAETYLVAWRRLDELLGARTPQAWLYGVAYKVLSNQRRTQNRQAALVEKTGSINPGESALDPAWSVEQRDAYTRVTNALGTLSEKDQEILRLVAYEELDHREIGEALGLSRGLVRTRLLRARRRLEAALNAIEPRHPTGTGHKGHEATPPTAPQKGDDDG